MKLADDQKNPEAHDFPTLQSDDKTTILDQMPSSLEFPHESLEAVGQPLMELEYAHEFSLFHVGRQCQLQGRNQLVYWSEVFRKWAVLLMHRANFQVH